MTRSALDTPMMRQYQAIKAQHRDAIVFYRMGDFYEMFLEDAERAAPILEIALTTRDKGKPDAVPMCGVPVHSAAGYVKRLAGLGHRVAICEQVESPAATGGKRLVRREVVEVVTPGLVGDPEGLEARREVALVALEPGSPLGLAVIDASTGDLRATQIPSEEGRVLPSALLEELKRVEPREILTPSAADAEFEQALAGALPAAALTRVDPGCFDPAQAPAQPQGFQRDTTDPATRAAAALLAYLERNQPFALAQVSRLRLYELGDAMVLDAATRTHLELFCNSEDGTRARTLVERLDETATPLGARRLARWISYPLIHPVAIAGRQDAVAHLTERDRARARVRERLREVRDLERLLARAARPTATPRDLVALRASLEALPAVARALTDSHDELLESANPLPPALPIPTPLPEAAQLLRDALVDEPPAVARGSRGALETGYIRAGWSAELDGLREGVRKGREGIAGLEAGERQRSGISNLRVRFHPVHGYSLEVTKTHLEQVPSHYERKQTLANAERFTTPDLREMERGVLGGNERGAALEREIFESVRCATLEYADAVREAAEAVAVLDATASLAEVARRDGWVRPTLDESGDLEIRAGRHPVVEPLLRAAAGASDEFVPNDTDLSPDATQLLILTGPNMSGKSTYLRQVALIVLLAQMGSCVPAESARIGVVDRVFTRVGASDRLARGESTFMVEMRETAEILAGASPRSLIILDEIGRGTSTFDGLSIAWAVAEYLHDTPGLRARTLFATHYHELTDLARLKERVANAHFEAREWDEEVVFLRRLVAGGANRSYGIQVARLAGLPDAVIERARQILNNLEGDELDAQGRPRLAGRGASEAASDQPGQLGLFGSSAPSRAERDVLEALRQTDPERTAPLDALGLLASWRRLLDEEGDE